MVPVGINGGADAYVKDDTGIIQTQVVTGSGIAPAITRYSQDNAPTTSFGITTTGTTITAAAAAAAAAATLSTVTFATAERRSGYTTTGSCR